MSILRWVLLVVSVFVAMAMASWCSTSHSWPEAVQWEEARRAQWGKDHRPCPLLHGEPADGVAYDSYVEAARLAAAVEDGEDRLAALAAAEAAARTEADGALLAAMAPAVAVLQRAARQRCPMPAAGGLLAGGAPHLAEYLQVTDALVVIAADRARTDAAAAALLLLDGMRMGVDFAASTVPLESMIGSVIVERCLQKLGDGVLQALDATSLAQLGSALAAVDAVLPARADRLPQTCLEIVRQLGADQPAWRATLGFRNSLRSWRYGFDTREWLRAEVAGLVAVLVRHENMAPAPGAPWPEVEQALERLQAEAEPIAAGLSAGNLRVVQAERGLREQVAGVRLLRMAVAFHQRLPVPTLRDPLGGGDLGTLLHGDEATFTSAEAKQQRTTRRLPR